MEAGEHSWSIRSFVGNGNLPDSFKPFSYTMGIDCIDEIGVAGQQNANPPGYFNLHFVVKYNNKIYDPSYGTKPFSGNKNGKEEHEAASIDGIYTKVEFGGVERIIVIRNYLGIDENHLNYNE